MKLIQKRYNEGDTGKVESVFGGYPLPAGLAEGESVVVVLRRDDGYVDVKTERGQFHAFMAYIDSGWLCRKSLSEGAPWH